MEEEKGSDIPELQDHVHASTARQKGEWLEARESQETHSVTHRVGQIWEVQTCTTGPREQRRSKWKLTCSL